MATAEPGWYDDGTGAQRWWDGAKWTDDYADFRTPDVALRSGASLPASPDEFGGIVVDARLIRLGALSQPIGGVVASVATRGDLAKRPSVTIAARARTLSGPHGPITPRQFSRIDPRWLHVVVESAHQVWLTPVAAGDEARARQFATWVNASADHYRYG